VNTNHSEGKYVYRRIEFGRAAPEQQPFGSAIQKSKAKINAINRKININFMSRNSLPTSQKTQLIHY
jgi:hypothetical protein